MFITVELFLMAFIAKLVQKMYIPKSLIVMSWGLNILILGAGSILLILYALESIKKKNSLIDSETKETSLKIFELILATQIAMIASNLFPIFVGITIILLIMISLPQTKKWIPNGTLSSFVANFILKFFYLG